MTPTRSPHPMLSPGVAGDRFIGCPTDPYHIHLPHHYHHFHDSIVRAFLIEEQKIVKRVLNEKKVKKVRWAVWPCVRVECVPSERSNAQLDRSNHS